MHRAKINANRNLNNSRRHNNRRTSTVDPRGARGLPGHHAQRGDSNGCQWRPGHCRGRRKGKGPGAGTSTGRRGGRIRRGPGNRRRREPAGGRKSSGDRGRGSAADWRRGGCFWQRQWKWEWEWEWEYRGRGPGTAERGRCGQAERGQRRGAGVPERGYCCCSAGLARWAAVNVLCGVRDRMAGFCAN